MQYSVGSLFAGVGGICLGFKKASYNGACFKVIWANEIDAYACVTYRLNFEGVEVIEGDIERIVNPDIESDRVIQEKYKHMQEQITKYPVDILTAGFPCQAFSIAGYRKGFGDSRGNLFWSILDIIELQERVHRSKPQVVFLENVKNLKNHDQGRTYMTVRDELTKIGYTVVEAVINTKDITDLPQNRERIYIIGFLDKNASERFSFPEAKKRNLTEQERKKRITRVLDLHLTKENAKDYYYTKEKYPLYFSSNGKLSDSSENRLGLDIETDITEEFEFYQIRRGMYVRKNQSGVCPTLTANMGTGGHNVPLIKVEDGIRKLTPAETFKLQGFPVGKGYRLPKEFNGRPFSDGRLYKQAGNAVSVDVITLIAEKILQALSFGETDYAGQPVRASTVHSFHP